MSKKVLKPGISTTGEKVRFAMGDVGFNIMWGVRRKLSDILLYR